MKKRGFTLIELLVVIAIIAMLLAILMPALNKVKKIAQRVVCGTNLKGLGTAQTVYANDYDDEYTVQGQGGPHNWVEGVTDGVSFQNTSLNWKTAQNITIGASLYLLVREADVSPKSFVCPSSDQKEFSGKNANNLDIVQLWDFGHPVATASTAAEGPINCVSYSYHQPYAAGQSGAASTGSKGRYAADGTRSAAFAVMADQNPYFEEKLTRGGVTQENYMERVTLLGGPSGWTEITNLDKWRKDCANALPHSREGQNVLFGDGHSSNESRTDVGVKNDGIYTKWAGTGATENDRRLGTYIADRAASVTPVGNEDSVLVNDGKIAP
jgi:prepilin-type N-terminal cleavage/methylation domain-containing protein